MLNDDFVNEGVAEVSQTHSDVSETKIVAFFDVDQTLMRGSSSYYVARELFRRKFFGVKDIFFTLKHTIMYLLFGESDKRMQLVKNRALAVMAGHSVDEIIQIGEYVYETCLENRLFTQSVKLLQKHIDAGHDVWIVSAIPVQIANIFAERIGATGALATEAKVIDGIVQPELIGTFVHGKGKAEVALKLAEHKGYDLLNSFAYGDSNADISLLSLVGNPNAVNPDRVLRKYAQEHGWNILKVKNTFSPEP